eukprot:518453-Pyramimonas_sp.AAC.1
MHSTFQNLENKLRWNCIFVVSLWDPSSAPYHVSPLVLTTSAERHYYVTILVCGAAERYYYVTIPLLQHLQSLKSTKTVPTDPLLTPF